MKKSSFVALVMGTVSMCFFALGMCMALLPEWNAFNQGIILGTLGIILGLITIFVWRKMEHKAPIKLDKKSVLIALFAVIGALILGIGMCLCLVWSNFIWGIVIGVLGILILISLIPLIKGVK